MKYNIQIINDKNDNPYIGQGSDVIINGVKAHVHGDGVTTLDGWELDDAIWSHVLHTVLPNKKSYEFFGIGLWNQDYFKDKAKGYKELINYFNQFEGMSNFIIDGEVADKLYKAWYRNWSKLEKKRVAKQKRECKRRGVPYKTKIKADRIILEPRAITSNQVFKLSDDNLRPFRPLDVVKIRKKANKKLEED